MHREQRTFLQRFLQGPVVALSSAPPVALADVRGRAVARLPCAPVRRWPFGHPVMQFVVTDGSFTVVVSGRMPESFDPVTPPLILASPSAFPPSRAGHVTPRGTRDLPLSKLRPGDRPSPDGPVNVYSQSPRTPSVDGCHTTDLAPTSWFLTTSPVSSVHGSPHVAAGTGSGFARFSSGSFVEAEASRDGSGVLTGAHPFEGLLLVDSRTASLRPAPLLPFVAMSTSRPPSLRSDHHLAVMLGFERFVPRATGSDVSVVSADPPELLMLRRAVCLFAVGCPSTPSGVRPGTGRLTGHPVLARSGRVVSRRSFESPIVSSPHLSMQQSTTFASPPRSLGSSIDPGLCFRSARSVGGSSPRQHTSGCVADRVVPSSSDTWRSVHAPADFRVFLHRRVRIPHRRCQRCEICSFLGFVSPPRLVPPPPLVPTVSRGSDPVTGLRLGRVLPCGSTRRTADGVCSVVEATAVSGDLPPWGSRRQRAVGYEPGFAASSLESRHSPLSSV
jgi:hypothetical protein